MGFFGQNNLEESNRVWHRVKSAYLHPTVVGLFAFGAANLVIRSLVQLYEGESGGWVMSLIVGPWVILFSLLVGLCVGIARFLYVRGGR